MPIHSLTAEKMDELKSKIEAGKDVFKKTRDATVQDMWLADLHELKKAL